LPWRNHVGLIKLIMTVDIYLKHWSDKTILITGGSSGIGFAIAEYLNGVVKNLIIVADKIERLRLAEAKLVAKEGHSNILAIVCNIGDSKQIKSMVERVNSTTGCPQIIINNAGFAHYHTFEQMTEEEVEETANVNFVGFLRVTRAFIPHIIKEKLNACIVNIASVAGAFPITPNSVYGGAKAGMLAFSELLEIELRPFGINVLSVCPGRVLTPFFDHESYRTRNAGSETKITTPIEQVVHGLIKSVALGKKVIFIPKYWQLFSWWIGFDRLILRRLYKLFLSRRVAKLRNL